MRYQVELTKSDEGYAVGCPELPGCSSEGHTEEEAISNIREAIQERLAGLPKAGPASETRFVEVPDTAAHNEPAKKARRTKFVVTPIASGILPPEWTSHKVEDLMRILAKRAER